MKKKVLKVISLDFDDTLVESNAIKEQAFDTIFSQWPEQREAMMRWHLDQSNSNADRGERFRYFVEEILEEPGNNELIEKLTDNFSEMVRTAIIDCPMVEGVQVFLDYYEEKVPMFLISATPQNELDKILKGREMDGYFRKVYGSPIDKVKVMCEIISDEKASPNEMLYIGDSTGDQEAAMKLGIHFIGIQAGSILNDIASPVYPNFTKVNKYLDERFQDGSGE